jgi:capsular exopolysaccharide synthesis family protein
VVYIPKDDLAEAADNRPSPSRRSLLDIAWKRKRLVALGVVVGLVLASLFQMQRPPVYQSTAQVLVVKKRTDVLYSVGNDSHVGINDDFISTHLVLIKSQVVVDRAVKIGDLGQLPSLRSEGDPTPAIIDALAADRAIKEPTLGTGDNVISLSYRGADPDGSAAVLKALIESYRQFLNEAYRDFSGGAIDVVTQDHKKNEKALVKKREDYQDFLAGSPLLAVGQAGSQPAMVRLADLETKRLALEVRAADLEERLRTIEVAKTKGNAREVVVAMLVARAAEKERGDKGMPFNDTDSAIEQQLITLLLQEQTLVDQYGGDHPDVRVVRKKIEMTRGLMGPDKKEMRLLAPGSEGGVRLEDAYAASLKQELEDVTLARKSMGPLTAEELKEARRLTGFANKDRDFQSEITRLEAQYDLSKKRLDEINLMRDFGGYEAIAISRPEPGLRVGVGLAQILLAGGVLGLLCGIGLAYLADATDTSFRNPEEIRRRLGLPIVGHVPLFRKEAALAEAPADQDGPHLDPSLSSYYRTASPEAEAYRSVRTSIFFSARGGGHKVIQVTSPSMGDGKTTLAANLAIAIAQSGKSVVLVDADLRRPRVAQYFGLTPPSLPGASSRISFLSGPVGLRVHAERGLTSVIVGETGLDGALCESGVQGLSLLPSGPRPVNPAELLTMPQFEQLIAELRGRFEFVVLDTPPLLAVTDPCVVASRVDGVLLTIRVSKNGRPAAERAREMLLTLQAKVLGVVINGVGKGVGHYGYENYEYGYGYEETPDGETPGGGSEEVASGSAGGARPNGRGRRRVARPRRASGWFGRWWR